MKKYSFLMLSVAILGTATLAAPETLNIPFVAPTTVHADDDLNTRDIYIDYRDVYTGSRIVPQEEVNLSDGQTYTVSPPRIEGYTYHRVDSQLLPREGGQSRFADFAVGDELDSVGDDVFIGYQYYHTPTPPTTHKGDENGQALILDEKEELDENLVKPSTPTPPPVTPPAPTPPTTHKGDVNTGKALILNAKPELDEALVTQTPPVTPPVTSAPPVKKVKDINSIKSSIELTDGVKKPSSDSEKSDLTTVSDDIDDFAKAGNSSSTGAKELPKTGDSYSTVLGAAGIALTSLIGLIQSKKRKSDK